MIVEFTGCSGAGKTALVRRVGEALRGDQYPVFDPFELFLGKRLRPSLHARCATSTSAANVAVELLGWPSTLLGRRRFTKCDAWVRTQIRNVALSRREWLRLTRSWNRKIAVMVRGTVSPAGTPALPIFLHDEGTVHFATTLLARSTGPLADSLDQYLDLVPLPDHVIYLSASKERSALRLTQRRFGPAPDRQGAVHDRFLQRARDVVQRLRAHPRIVPRLLHIENDSDDPHALIELARVVACHVAGPARVQFPT